MSNFIYPKAKQAMLSGLDLTTASVVIKLSKNVSGGNTADDNVSDLVGADIVATSSALTSKTIVDGVFDAADVTYTSLAVGPAIRGYHVCVSTTGLLVAWIDTNQNTTPINVTPDGTNFTLRFAASGIFQL